MLCFISLHNSVDTSSLSVLISKKVPMGVESITVLFCCGFSFLLCAVGILCICLCAASPQTNKCAETERQALLKFKDGLLHGRHSLTSWIGENCCKWKGISCDNLTGHVTSLDLATLDYSEALGGKLDSSLCELQHLTSLNLSFNRLEGKIPKCIGSLGQLIELKLGNNELAGVIPPTLGNLSKLQTLDLRWNYDLVANDLEWLSHLSNLRYLDLSIANLSLAVDWLSSISKIPSLMELYLHFCWLYQVRHKSIPHLNSSTSLKILDLSENNLNSSTLSLVLNVSKVLTSLYLQSNYLQNSIPNGFGNMISLQYLDLSDNELEGSIPKSFRSLCQLKTLKMWSNKLSGQLRDNIRQLCCAQNGLELLDLGDNPFNSGPLPNFSCFSSLRTLSLRNTNVFGPLLESFVHLPSLLSLDLSHNQLNGVDVINEAHLSNLQTLDLSFNQLSGTLPFFEVTKLASLEQLDLSHNQLNGSFPCTIGQLSNLEFLSLSSNKLNGVISEAHLSKLSILNTLEASENSLSFNLSSNWVPPFQLYTLYASSCILGPKFPIWLKHQRKLTNLEISNSGISDSFPKWFWGLSSSLTYLNVSHNNLSGVLPKSLPSVKTNPNLNVWDFSFNNLSGPLPPFPKLSALFLSNNMFSGSLSSFCTASPLYFIYLDLSSNLLAGPLLDCWGNFQHLRVLNLAKNNLSGKVPNSFGTLRQIESIHLNNNNFSGEFPSLTLCSSLTLIDVGNNNLQGLLPAWIGHHLHQLIVLHLRENKFQGNIPASLCNLSFLQVLDISKNNMTGEIPQCFSHIIALSNTKFPRKTISYLSLINSNLYNTYEIGLFSDKAILAWKGANREYGKNLGFMTTIDLSCNHLTGEIPQSITKLVALAGLNLSGNNLTGFIPTNIGHMKMLESLDLSRNHICGRMPASFSNLTFLSYLNLAFNNLSGKIPLSTQLQSFGALAYEGNNGLCGPPLTIHCPISPTRNPNKHGNNEDELITFGFYVSLGLGFCVGFWGICGTLVIKPSWRHTYFQFFSNMNDWMHVTLAVFMARMKRRFQDQD